VICLSVEYDIIIKIYVTSFTFRVVLISLGSRVGQQVLASHRSVPIVPHQVCIHTE